MLNRSASLAMSTSVLKALPGKLDIKRHSPSILYLGVHRKASNAAVFGELCRFPIVIGELCNTTKILSMFTFRTY